jgi:hypothetical protein
MLKLQQLTRKRKSIWEKKAKAKPTNSDLFVAFPELEKRLEVFEAFMKKYET